MRIDLHVHTRHSGDSLCSPADAVRMAKKKGLDGIAIADHDTCRGWEEAIRAGKDLGILVIQAEEVLVKIEGRPVGEILGYFLKEPVKSRDPKGVIEEIKAQGGMAVVSHPLDRRRRFERLDTVIGMVQGLEVMNARAPKEANQRAMELAEGHGLAKTGGSDAHSAREVGAAWTEAEASDLEEFREAILEGRTRVGGKESSKLVRVFSTMAKIRGLKEVK